MPAPARAKTAHWAPKGPKTRPFRHGVRTDADAEQPLSRGTVIADRYRIEGMIGQGGMGRVYAATHLQQGHRVALKLLRTKRSEREQAARLRQEAKAASRIGHRAIVSVLDFDTTPDGLSYLAMELLTGESFEDWLERPGRMLDGVRWLAEAARATGGRLITLELAAHKQAQAREMAEAAGLAASIDFRLGDAVALIGALECRVDLVLLDLWKDLYVPCLEALLPKLNPGAILVADNMIRPPSEGARAYGARVRSLPGVGSLLLPVGSGIEVSRFPGG